MPDAKAERGSRGDLGIRGPSEDRARSARPHGAEIYDVCVIGTGAGGGVMIQELTAAGFRVVALQRGPLLVARRLRRRRAQGDDPRRAVLAAPDRDLPTRRQDADHHRQVQRHRRLRRRHDDALVGVVVALPARRAAGVVRRGPARRRQPRRLAVSLRGDRAVLREGRVGLRRLGQRRGQSLRRAAQEGLSEPAAPRARLEPALRARRREARLPSVPAPGRDQLAALRQSAAPACTAAPATASAVRSTPRRRRSRCASRRRRRPASSTSAPTSSRARSPSARTAARAACATSTRPARSTRSRRRQIVVSGNSIGSSHLLLMSKSGSFPQGLANSSGLVGKNLMFHIVPAVAFTDRRAGARRDRHQRPRRGRRPAPERSRSAVSSAAASSASPTPARRPRCSTGRSPVPAHRWTRSWGAPLKAFLKKFPRAVLLAGVLEDLPMEKNRVDLDPTVKDRFGSPGAAHHPRPAPERPRDAPLVSTEAARHRGGRRRDREVDLARCRASR